MKHISLLICLLFSFGRADAQRLPRTLIPEHYQIVFNVDLSMATFNGEETIDVEAQNSTSIIELHSLELNLQDITVTSEGKTQKVVATTNPTRETVSFLLKNSISRGAASIHILFDGKLNDQLRGFYLSKGKDRNYAVTQMEATDARRAFPCFDEPAMKATFDISVVTDLGSTAISNGKIISDTPGPGSGKHTLRFSTTPKMSSYLVAVAIGDFNCLEGEADGTPIRICAAPEKHELGKFALQVAEQSIRFYDQYFGTRYPFPKLDIVAVPDFLTAMENTAAIIGREDLLLLNEPKASVDSKKEVATALAHEIAHQWFGDLVTMEWWDDIWLNEGFAQWMQTKPIAVWRPEWKIQMDEATERAAGISTDSLQSTRAIHAKATTSAEIAALFEGITYMKASAVLRMVESSIGKEAFQAGVSQYLKTHAYSNATAEDFWSALARVSHKPVDRVMAGFVIQKGVPLVYVKAKCRANTTVIELAQQRFFYDSVLLEKGSNELWDIPVCIRTATSNTPQCKLLNQRRKSFRVSGCQPWIYANAGGDGYYRTAYDAETTRRLAAALDSSLSPKERISLLEDQWALMQAGRAKIGDFLFLAEKDKNDRERAVVEVLGRRIRYISDYLISDGVRPQYESWVRNLLGPMSQELGWTMASSESEERRSLRAAVLYTLGYAGKDPETISHSKRLLRQEMQKPGSVDPTLLDTLIQVAAVDGDQALYDEFVAKVKMASASPEEHQRYLLGLTTFQNPELVKRTLEYYVSSEMQNQDVYILNFGWSQHPNSNRQRWDFVKSHWPQYEKKFSEDLLVSVVYSMRSFCDVSLRDEVIRFFSQHRIAPAEDALKQQIERINLCIDLKSNQQPKLGVWFQPQRPTTK